MKVSVRFAIAKYVPDLYRMEPRNFGVVTWASNGVIVSKFAKPSDRSVRMRIIEKDSRHAYAQWLSYWDYYFKSESINSSEHGVVSRKSPQFFDALIKKSKERFRLVEAGGFLEKIPESQLQTVTDELYQRVVELHPAAPALAEQEDLRVSTRSILERVKLPELHKTIPITGHVMGAKRKFTVDYVLGEIDSPKAIMQQVLLSRSQNINSNCLMFHALTVDSDAPLKKGQCAALINTDHPIDDNSKEGLEVIDKMAVIIDVSKANAEQQILRFAEQNKAA